MNLAVKLLHCVIGGMLQASLPTRRYTRNSHFCSRLPTRPSRPFPLRPRNADFRTSKKTGYQVSYQI
jgi:hypothetical protein